MNPLLKTIRAYAADAREAFRVAPVEVLLGVLVAVTFSVSARAGANFPEESWVRVLAWGWLSFSPLLALTALHLRGAIARQTRVWGAAAVLLIAGLYAFGPFDPEHAAEMWRFVCLMVAGISFVLLTPAIQPRAGSRLEHWQFAFGLLARAAGVAAYSAVIFGALCGAVASVVNLFELSEPKYLYQDLAGLIFFAAAPWLLVGGVPRLIEDSVRPRDSAPLAVVRFGRFIYLPVLVVYLGILYAYAARVLLTQELPKNLVSPLVLAAGLLGMAGALLLEPLHADREHRGLSLMVRWVPALLLVLLPFAYVAILMRQGQYGWTEFRYLRLAGCVMLTLVAILGTVWLARRRMPPLASVPGILALGMLLVSVGPWSAQAVSRRDQTARLRAMLSQAGARLPLAVPAPDSRPAADSVTVTEEQAEAIRGAISYLVDSHGAASLEGILGPRAGRYQSGWQLAQAVPLRTRCTTPESWGFEARLLAGTPIEVPAGRLVRIDHAAMAPTHMLGADRNPPYVMSEAVEVPDRARAADELRFRVDGRRLLAEGASGTLVADLVPLARSLASSRPGECTRDMRSIEIPAASARVPLRRAGGAQVGWMVVTDLRTRQTPGYIQVVGADGYLLIQ